MRLLIILLLNISFIFSQEHFRRCSLTTTNESYRLRPELDTFASSPSGHFYIHYDLDGINAPLPDDLNNNGIPDYIEAVGVAAD